MNRTKNIQEGKKDISKYIEFVEALETGTCKCCCNGAPILSVKNIDYYEHSGGIMTPFASKKQWVSVECRNCGFKWSWWKILRRVPV